MPIIVKDALGSLSNELSESHEEKYMVALKMTGLYFGLSILSGIFLYFTRQTIIKMSRHIEYDLKNEIFKKYQTLEYAFYKKNKTGDLINRISEDVSKVRMYLGPAIMYSINLVFLSGLALYKMIQINGQLTLFALLPLPIMSILIYFVSKKINLQSIQVQKTQSNLSSFVQETFMGIQTIKSYTLEEDRKYFFDENANEYKNDSMRLVLINALFMPTIIVLISLSTLLTIYVGGVLTHQGSIVVEDIVAFIMYVNFLTWPFASIGWVTSIIQRASASQTRINEFLLEPSTIQWNHEDNYKVNGTIEFKNVNFTYENTGIQALKNISFKIETGKTLGIIGSTGSGKSTIVNLIGRLFDPNEGEVLIDSRRLDEIDLGKYRDQIGIIPQDVFLFSDTIKNNINFGLYAPASDEETAEAAKKAHVHHNIMDFDKKYETLLGERGVNLSGGQKQRISVARAFIKSPKIIVFDDSFSAIDTETEEIILQQVKQMDENPTTVIISHRISTLKHADSILVMDEGSIIARGAHEELLQSSEMYRELSEKQQ